MSETILIGGTQFPVECTCRGRQGKRIKSKDADLYSILSSRYKGPYTPVDSETHEKLPTMFGVDKLETAEGQMNCCVVYDDISHPGGAVIDNNGTVVVETKTWGDAFAVSSALNRLPLSITDGSLLGLSPSHGVAKTCKDDKFAFWCIQVPMVDINDRSCVKWQSYVAPFYKRNELPNTLKNPIAALRFHSVNGASKVIDIINGMLNTIAEDRGRNITNLVRNGHSDPTKPFSTLVVTADWKQAKPVMIKYAYNVLS